MQPDSNLFSGGLKFDTATRNTVKQIASWAMIIVVVTVIGYVFSLIAVFTQPEVTFARVDNEGFSRSILATGGASKSSAIFSVLIGLAVNYFLFRFATYANASVKSGSTIELSSGFRHLKIYFAILTVVLLIALVIVVFAVIAASLSR